MSERGNLRLVDVDPEEALRTWNPHGCCTQIRLQLHTLQFRLKVWTLLGSLKLSGRRRQHGRARPSSCPTISPCLFTHATEVEQSENRIQHDPSTCKSVSADCREPIIGLGGRGVRCCRRRAIGRKDMTRCLPKPHSAQATEIGVNTHLNPQDSPQKVSYCLHCASTLTLTDLRPH